MKKSLLFLPVLLAIGVSTAPANDGSDRDGGDERGGARSNRQDPLSEMSSEQRDRVRKALKAVWDDEGVLAAKKAMSDAAAAYREALREAVGKEDPEIREMLDRALRDRFRRQMHDHPGGRGMAPGLPKLEDLPEEMRGRMKAVFDRAANDPELRKLRENGGSGSDEERMKRFRRSGARFREIVSETDAELLKFFRPPGPPKDKDRKRGEGEPGKVRPEGSGGPQG